MRLIIVRHGETEDNIRKIIQGQRHGKLTKRGINQARRAASKLRKERIDVILTSDLRRAVHTAKEIARFHDAPMIYSKSLRERDMGVFQGKSRRLVDLHRAKVGLREAEFRPRGGESYIDVKKRVGRFMKKMYREHKHGTVLVVTHGVVIRALLSIYTKIPIRETPRIMIKNAGIMILEIRSGMVKEIEEDIFM